ncbi:MAG: DUF4276 family protein [Verrucomicrobia bacterium]|nr:DUF4276 family protein [Verrucomicrobiota bacterium]
MSLKVLVIPEDFTKDEHILLPLVSRIVEECGRKGKVRICRDPNFQGVDAALDLERLRTEVIGRQAMVDWFLLIVDRDGQKGREDTAARLEAALDARLGPSERRFVVTLAYQEVEALLLAGHELPPDWSWQEMRADADVKNTYFKKFVALGGTKRKPHEGRQKLMAEAMRNWNRIKARCPEDVGRLIARLRG